MRAWVLAGILVSVFLAGIYVVGFRENPNERVFVGRVIDGDTIEIEGGKRVRLLGIDAPEKGQFLYNESTEWLTSKIEGREVKLEADEEKRDKYGRLLKYVFLGNEFINLELVKQGYAKALIIPPNERYAEQILEAEEKAREKKIGIWKFDQDLFCIGIFHFHYNAEGNDNENLNDEYVVFRNRCEKPVNMVGWVLSDRAGNEYRFTNFSAQPKEKFALHTGLGKDNRTDLYWGRVRAVWNNDGDRLIMYNVEGNIVLNFSY